jgi:hypothetical protein
MRPERRDKRDLLQRSGANLATACFRKKRFDFVPGLVYFQEH